MTRKFSNHALYFDIKLKVKRFFYQICPASLTKTYFIKMTRPTNISIPSFNKKIKIVYTSLNVFDLFSNFKSQRIEMVVNALTQQSL